MIRLKTDKDIQLIEKAIEIGKNALSVAKQITVVGITTQEIDRQVEAYILKKGAAPSFKGYKGFPTACCISLNNEIVHGYPRDNKIKSGDIVKIDIGICFKSRYSDQAITFVVGEGKSKKHLDLVYTTKLALERAKKVAIPNNTLNQISWEIQRTAQENGLGIVTAYTGHGVGFEIHEEPIIRNIVTPNENMRLVKGMVLAIEPMFALGKGDVEDKGYAVVTKDNSMSSHFEETIIVR